MLVEYRGDLYPVILMIPEYNDRRKEINNNTKYISSLLLIQFILYYLSNSKCILYFT